MTPEQRLREVEREILARRPEHAIEPTRSRMAELALLLGDPQRAYPVIHITGTNGKTSTARMIETLLRSRGLRTGLFTSPHLSSIRERIAVDGEPLPAEAFVDVYDEVAPYLAMVDERQPVRLSFFEVLTAMAFAAFADAPVDVAVIEVGLGGTWDATNVADGAVAVVTPVAIDHTRYLGDTVDAIAAEKAGIIKKGAVAVLAQQPVEAAEVLLRRAAEVGASVAREGLEFGVTSRELAVGGQRLSIHGLRGDYDDLLLPLFGEYQAGNAACALAAVEAFAGAGAIPAPAGWQDEVNGTEVSPESRAGLAVAGYATPVERRDSTGAGEGGQLDPGLVREAFAAMTSPGRLEVVRRSPVVLVDSAHNPAGMAAAAAALTEAFTFSGLVGVLAVSMDKDVAGILDELEPVISELVVTRNSSSRSMDPETLAELASEVFGPDRVRLAERLDEALEIAVGLADDAAGADGLGTSGVLVTGSVITAGDARLLLTAPRRGSAEQA
ncbi:MAG: dihydrofolate synthase / folylpolyglutamate synthase [Streptosporangiaceae bacterium]|nr:dihydrofolate synthase / folylpolyglutamate synthase [Streptosporangiaceae bacterium]